MEDAARKRAERVESLAHDLGSPLLAITLSIQVALKTLPADAVKAREALTRAQGQTERLAELVRTLNQELAES